MSYWNMQPVKYTGNKSELNFKPEYRYYNPEEVILGKTMEDWCRFSVAYWHTINQRLVDPFGDGTAYRPYDNFTDPMDQSLAKMEAMFELCETLGVKFFTFHDRDIAPEGDTLRETNKNLDKIVDKILELQKTTDVKILWNTCNLFGNPRFLAGAATSPYADVFAYAAAQLKKSLEIGKQVGSENFVFWGGREGYETLLNTDLGREKEHMAKFMHMAVDYAKEIGFEAQFLIEPKPKEPTTHQYDFDTATAISFLKNFGLDKYFKMNIEGNHANLAAHTYQHELAEANACGMLGSLDANQGDTLIGWDIDEFPSNLYETSMVMYEVINNGSIGPKGGLNFDSKPRRTSYKPEDLFYTHIVGIDTFAAGLRVAAKLHEDKALKNIVSKRYESFDSGIGSKIESGEADLKILEDYIIDKTNEDIYAACDSDHSECTKDIINRYIINALK